MHYEEIQVQYNMQIYNDYVDFPITMTNIEGFDFDKLLSHPNPKVRAFNFIVITKCTVRKQYTTIQPVIVIYSKKDWQVQYEYIKDCHSSRIKTWCSNRKQRLDFNGNLIKLPCNNQREIISMFNFVSKILIAKNKVKNKVFTLLK